MTQERIDRISELTRISRERELTKEEKAERAALRREYIESVIGSLKSQLDHTYIVEPDGEKHPLRKETKRS